MNNIRNEREYDYRTLRLYGKYYKQLISINSKTQMDQFLEGHYQNSERGNLNDPVYIKEIEFIV